jgi:GAF domain
MRSATVRLLLLILFVAAAAATGYYIWASETSLRVAMDASRRVDDGAVTAVRGVLDLRAAQQAYVAAGQGEDFWITKVAAALPDVKASIRSVRAHVASPRGETAADNALAMLEDFEQVDKRAREYALTGQRLIASDLIFSDGLEMTSGMLAALDEARTAERADYELSSRQIRQAEVLALASCAVFAVLMMGLLVPVREEPRADSQPAALPTAQPPASEALDLALDRNANNWARDSRPAAPATLPPEPVSLEALASLCTDLARVVDTRSLPAILERAATALGASGIVLWIADPDGRELAPIVAHGYSPHVLSRLGTIARDAQNVTGDAYRTGLVQTVKADATSNGAIAAPLMTPAGAVGVMAAEVRQQGEQQPAKLAAASIIAAQIATLVGPPVSRVPSKEAAGA